MKIQENTITYDEKELEFIETLTPQQQRYIMMGICTVRDCGYVSGVTLDED
jgi:hypothetical protein